MAEIRCKKCGKKIEKGYTFCMHCGAKAEKAPEPVAVPVNTKDTTDTGSAKLRMAIIGGIALVGIIILIALIGGIKNYNKPTADPIPDRAAEEVFEPEELPEQSAEEPAPEPELEPEAEPEPEVEAEPEAEAEPEPEPVVEPVDSNSVIIPDFADYFWSKRSFEGGYGDVGYKYEMKNFPDDIREGIMEEVFALLEDPQYQLEFDWVDEYYYSDGTGESHRYHYVYTGTNPNITEVTHPNRVHPFEFVLCFYDTSYTDGVFSLGFQFNKNFEEVKTGEHTGQPVEKDFYDSGSGSNSGGVPDVSGTYDHTPPASKLKCLTCDGDGDCNTCGGSGYKRVGGVKGGCTTCRGNGKCRTCHGSGTR